MNPYEIKHYELWTLEECQVNGLNPAKEQLYCYRLASDIMNALRRQTVGQKLSTENPEEAEGWFKFTDLLIDKHRRKSIITLLRFYRPILRLLEERGFIEQRHNAYPEIRLSRQMRDSHLKYNRDFIPEQFRDAVMFYLVTNGRVG